MISEEVLIKLGVKDLEGFYNGDGFARELKTYEIEVEDTSISLYVTDGEHYAEFFMKKRYGPFDPISTSVKCSKEMLGDKEFLDICVIQWMYDDIKHGEARRENEL